MIHSVMFRSLWQYRGFVWGSVQRQFDAKYRNSLFGAFWAAANPLAMITIYTVVFAQLMRPNLAGHEQTPFAFSIYLCAGVIPWNLFADILSRMNNVFLENGNLIKKANFPRICLPTIVTFAALIDFAILLSIFLVFLLLIGHWPGWALLALLPVILLQLMLTIGLGIALGTLNVFFRDVGQFTGVALQFWFWLTPIVYVLQALPQQAQALIHLNPMTPLVAAYQTIFLEKAIPNFSPLIPVALLALFCLALGAWLFLGRIGELVDEL